MIYTAQWFIDNGYRAIPTKPDNKKHVVWKYKLKQQCTVNDFRYGRGIKLTTGEQFNGLHLIALDDDHGGTFIQRIEQSEPLLYAKLVITHSTDGDGLHVFWLSNEAVAKGTAHVEVKCTDDNSLTAPDMARLVQGTSGFQTLSGEETNRILNLVGYKPDVKTIAPVAQKTVSQYVTTNEQYIDDPITDFNQRTDLLDMLETFGARRAFSGAMSFHCACSAHKNGDANPSLSVAPARETKHGAYILFGKSNRCIFAGYQNAFDTYRKWHGLSKEDALKQLYPDNLRNKPASLSACAPKRDAEIIVPVAREDDLSPEALRKRQERAIARDEKIAAIRVAIASDERLKPRAKMVAGALLQNGKLQSNATNQELGTATGYCRDMVRVAIGELKAAGYGTRHGGSFIGGVQVLPTWNWTFSSYGSVYSPVKNVNDASTNDRTLSSYGNVDAPVKNDEATNDQLDTFVTNDRTLSSYGSLYSSVKTSVTLDHSDTEQKSEEEKANTIAPVDGEQSRTAVPADDAGMSPLLSSLFLNNGSSVIAERTDIARPSLVDAVLMALEEYTDIHRRYIRDAVISYVSQFGYTDVDAVNKVFDNRAWHLLRKTFWAMDAATLASKIPAMQAALTRNAGKPREGYHRTRLAIAQQVFKSRGLTMPEPKVKRLRINKKNNPQEATAQLLDIYVMNRKDICAELGMSNDEAAPIALNILWEKLKQHRTKKAA